MCGCERGEGGSDRRSAESTVSANLSSTYFVQLVCACARFEPTDECLLMPLLANVCVCVYSLLRLAAGNMQIFDIRGLSSWLTSEKCAFIFGTASSSISPCGTAWAHRFHFKLSRAFHFTFARPNEHTVAMKSRSHQRLCSMQRRCRQQNV